MMRRLLAMTMILAASAAAAQQPGQALTNAKNEQRLKTQRLERARRDAAAVREDIDNLSRQLATLASQQSRSGDDVIAARARLEALNTREQALVATMAASRSRLSRLLGALQMYGRHPPPALLTHPRDARDAVRAAILMRALTPVLQEQAKAAAADVDTAMMLRRSVAAQSEGLFLSESEFAERAAQIEGLISEKAALENSLMAEAAKDERDLVALAARIQNLRGAAPAPPAKAPPADRRFATPVPGTPDLRFGQASERGGRLEGWLWRTAAGAQVRSPAAGVIEYAGPLEDWANVIIADVGDGRRLVLAGVGALEAKVGDTVAQGQLLALMPAARRPPPELYLEIRQGGEPVDPARFFAAIRQ